MKLSHRFIVLFISLTAIPLIFLSFIAVASIEEYSVQQTVRQLSSIADIQKTRINVLISNYLEQANLISSRNQLRLSVQEYVRTGNPVYSEEVRSVITELTSFSSNIEDIIIINTSGNVVAATSENIYTDIFTESFISSLSAPKLEDVVKDYNGFTNIVLRAPLVLDNANIGFVILILNADDLTAVTDDYSGLGETGETTLARRNANGDAVFISPLRFDSSAALSRAVNKSNTFIPIIPAIQGEERVITDSSTQDYRGEPVFAVTRFIDPVNWGFVVKIDRREVFSATEDLTRSVWTIFFVSFLIIGIVAYAVSRSISKPIEELTEVSKSIASGRHDHRTHIDTNDELGVLGTAFNTMAKKLEESRSVLEEKVRSRTQELEKSRKESEERAEEAERLNKVMVGRELKMIELKEEISQLKKKKNG